MTNADYSISTQLSTMLTTVLATMTANADTNISSSTTARLPGRRWQQEGGSTYSAALHQPAPDLKITSQVSRCWCILLLSSSHHLQQPPHIAAQRQLQVAVTASIAA
jgi:hypothetical protein